MTRPITLFTGQWADMPLEELAAKASNWGYDGLELACWGDHLNVERAASDPSYVDQQLKILHKHNLNLYAIGNHITGQLVCDPDNDKRSDALAPAHTAGDSEAKREWAIEQLKLTAKAAKNLGVEVVTGFTGSPIWHMFYGFPPITPEMIENGFAYFAEQWNPILDVFQDEGVKFALEVHPTEIAFDIVTAQRTLEQLEYRDEFGFNFDPSHLRWQMIDPVCFLQEFKQRIYHVHMKDAILTLDGRSGILCSHLDFGDPRRGWDFRSLGHGDIKFEEIIRVLNNIQYSGPLSVEWEDSGMDREFGAEEACEYVRNLDFPPSKLKFDSQMQQD